MSDYSSDTTVRAATVAMPTPPPYEGPEGDLPSRVLGMKVPDETAQRFNEALHGLGWRSQRDWLRACIDQTVAQAGA